MIKSVRFAEKPLQFNGMIMMTLMQTVLSPHVWGYFFLMKFTDRLKPLDSPKLKAISRKHTLFRGWTKKFAWVSSNRIQLYTNKNKTTDSY